MTRRKSNPLSKPEVGRLGGKVKVAKGFAKMGPEQLAAAVAKSHANRASNARARRAANSD